MTNYRRSFAHGIVALMLIVSTGCDKEPDSSSTPAKSESNAPSPKQGGESGDETAEGDREEHEHSMRLGLKMQDIGHRWAAIWFAGNAGRVELLDYQIHELRETIEQIERADIEEHGVDVAERLNSRVGSRGEELVEAVKSDENEDFQKTYREILGSCNSCHAETEHGFIEVTVPERNPYPNVRLSSDEGDE